MNMSPRYLLLASLTVSAGFLPNLTRAQVPQVPAATPSREEEPLVLNVFNVTSARDYGYFASNSATALGTGTPLMTTPITINIVTGDYIRDTGALNLQSVLERTAGVATNSRDRGSFFVRGFQAPVIRDGINSITAFVTDDFIDRVEVAKGANSVFFGNMAPGGLINVVTAKPDFERTHGTAELRYGSYDLKKAKIDVTGPLSKKVAYRFIASAMDKSDGFMDWTYQKTHGVFGAVTIRPTSRVQWTVYGEHSFRKENKIHSPARTSSAFLRAFAPNGVFDPTLPGVSAALGAGNVSSWVQAENNKQKALGLPITHFIDMYYPPATPRGLRANNQGPDAYHENTYNAGTSNLTIQLADWLVFRNAVNYARSWIDPYEMTWWPLPNGEVTQSAFWATGADGSTSAIAQTQLIANLAVGNTSHRLLLGHEFTKSNGESFFTPSAAVRFNPFTDGVRFMVRQFGHIPSTNINLSMDTVEAFQFVGHSHFFTDKLHLIYGVRRTEVVPRSGLFSLTGVSRPVTRTGADASDTTPQAGIAYSPTK
ncbi:MAG: TonB-dependent siderophore receptor, partial [Opitutaceae bacterium]